jgi:hypothetical protein
MRRGLCAWGLGLVVVAGCSSKPGMHPFPPASDLGMRSRDGGASDGGTADDGGGPPPPVSPYDCNWGPPVFTSLAPSTSPPGGLDLTNVPQFVAFAFDDNRYEDGLQWALDLIQTKKNPKGNGNHCTFDDTPARFTFFIYSNLNNNTQRLSSLHLRAYTDGNEVANHTNTHADDLQANTDPVRWQNELTDCDDYLTGLGIPRAEIVGFRTPFLQYTQSTFGAMVGDHMAYDCSVEHYLSPTGEDWPYTLDNGPSPHSYMRNDGTGNRAGLWELPVHEFMPPTGWVGITGLDYNIWCVNRLSPSDALATLKASLDLRFKGDSRGPANRAPLFVGGHSDLYDATNTAAASCANTVDQRRAVIEQFLDYALAYDPSVRVVPYGQIVNWMQHPIGLDGTKGQ